MWGVCSVVVVFGGRTVAVLRTVAIRLCNTFAVWIGMYPSPLLYGCNTATVPFRAEVFGRREDHEIRGQRFTERQFRGLTLRVLEVDQVARFTGGLDPARSGRLIQLELLGDGLQPHILLVLVFVLILYETLRGPHCLAHSRVYRGVHSLRDEIRYQLAHYGVIVQGGDDAPLAVLFPRGLVQDRVGPDELEHRPE